jgi:hypothetical protein
MGIGFAPVGLTIGSRKPKSDGRRQAGVPTQKQQGGSVDARKKKEALSCLKKERKG